MKVAIVPFVALMSFIPLGEVLEVDSAVTGVSCSVVCPSGACQTIINGVLAGGQDVQLTHGQTCSITGTIIVPPGRTLAGDGLSPKAIITTGTSHINGGAVHVRSNAVLRGLDIRGPYYGQGVGFISAATQAQWRAASQVYYGVNGSSGPGGNYNDDWLLEDVLVQGFGDNGVHVGASEDVTIINSTSSVRS